MICYYEIQYESTFLVNASIEKLGHFLRIHLSFFFLLSVQKYASRRQE